ncbi:methyltransferase domain-containing protein [Globomyces pollinis-pini]|nr:methyltransferase domain-containing protein [Globomyces pollinis-pini]
MTTIIDGNNEMDCRAYAQELIKFIDQSHWLLHGHNVDFYLDGFFEKLPAEWNSLLDYSMEELVQLGCYGTLRLDASESLRKFVTNSKQLPLNRKPTSDVEHYNVIQSSSSLHHLVQLGMNPKKVAEVQSLSSLIAHYCEKFNINTIIDMGSGQGYLDAALAFHYHLNVIGVDDNTVQTCGAICNLQKMEKYFFKNYDSNLFGCLFHINSRITINESLSDILKRIDVNLSDTIFDNLDQKPTRYGQEKGKSNLEKLKLLQSQDTSDWLLCGLHTCGDLAVSMIKQFIHSDAKVMINVGCCYNMITEPELDNNPTNRESLDVRHFGYPLSQFVRDQGLYLGSSSRMTACQAICRWSDDPSSIENFKKNAWRAMLQVVLVESGCVSQQEASKTVLGKLGKGAFKEGFVTYVEKALQKLKIQYPGEKISESLVHQVEEQYSSRMKEVAIIWTLRSLLSECIESLILVDRVLYVKENQPNTSISLIPIFDHQTSPRNMALICTKELQV